MTEANLNDALPAADVKCTKCRPVTFVAFSNSEPIEAATKYAMQGLNVFPVPPNTRKSRKSEKSSGTKWGMTNDVQQVGADFTKWRDSGVGIPTGLVNDIFIVEADTMKGHGVDGIASLKQLEAEYGKLPPTLMAMSPSGSLHYYFKHPGADFYVKNSTSELAPGVDVRGDGGMVIAPPTVRKDGRYQWLNSLDVAEPPRWLLEKVILRKDTSHEKGDAQVDATTVMEQLRVIPNDDLDWESWNRIGMAIWAATGGSDAGFAAFDQWSQKSKKYNAGTTRKKWNDISSCPPDRIGAGTLFHLAQESKIADVNTNYALVIVGDKTAIMNFEDKTKFRLLQVGAFKQWFSNRKVMIGEKKIPVAEYWLTHPHRRQYEGIEFAPIGGRTGYYNLWRGFAVEPREGNCQKFLGHLMDNVSNSDEYLYNWIVGWFAQIFQKLSSKMDTALALRGKMGVGKTKVGEVVGSLLGEHYLLVSEPRYIVGRFNSHMASLLLLHADEAFWAGDREAEGKLKDLVSGKQHNIELKGKEAFRINNYIRLFVTGNSDWIIPAGLNERRFAVVDVGTRHMQDHQYFAAIDAEMDNGGREALLHYLLNFDISSVNLRDIPKTAALFEQKIKTATPEETWWLDTLKRGELPWGTDEVNTCSKKKLFQRYIRHASLQGIRRRAIETTIGLFLKKSVGPSLRSDERLPFVVNTPGRGRVTRRDWCFRFPSLKECRDVFANGLQQDIPWDDPSEEWRHEEEILDDDAEW
jgi:hypothetical protein